MNHNHYFKDVSKYSQLDVYRALDLFGVNHPCQQHLAKKALCAGNRGHKDLLRDIQNIIDTAERWKEMLIEDMSSEILKEATASMSIQAKALRGES